MHSTFKLILSIVLTALIAAGGTGFGLYTWSQAEAEQNEIDQESTVSGLENLITTLEEENTELGKTITELEANQENNNFDLPVVVYGALGLLDEDIKADELAQIEQKLINPFVDYYNAKGETLLTMRISIPENIGDSYSVTAIFADGGNLGTSYGAREETHEFWFPICMGECEFTEEFAAKYPEIVNR